MSIAPLLALAAALPFATPATAPIASPAATTPAIPQDDHEALMEEVEELLRRLSIGYHQRAYEMLAKTQDPRAIEELSKRYLKPGFPKDATRNLIVSSLGKEATSGEIMDVLVAWMEDSDEPRDAYLWKQALALDVKENGPERALAAARNTKNILLRGAAVEALAAHRDKSLYELIPELLADMPKKEAERIALMGTLATALEALGTKKARVEKDWKQLALGMIVLLEDKKFPRSAKLILARHLARVLDADQVVFEANAWRALIAQRSQEEKEKKRAGDSPSGKGKSSAPEYVRPRFFGVEVTGDRICYLIDLSDSMAEDIPADWKPKGPLSGADEAKKKKKRARGELPTEADIPWMSVKTRFDLAREHLRISLQRLQPGQKFTVIGFGTNAEFIDGCKGMMKVTPGNVKKVLKSLDSIDIGPALEGRPHGTIWGDTNLHSGLRLAFSVTGKGAVDEDEYVDLDTFVQGTDTIFVLSDGNPSVDAYTVEDIDYGDAPLVDDTDERKKKERKKGEVAQRARYFGPYAHWPLLLDDVKRMNMFQQAEIHVIGIGDADEEALKRLADIGLGKLQIIGKDTK